MSTYGGNTEAMKRARKKHNEMLSRANKKAKQLFLNKIRDLSKPDKNKYNGIMFYVSLWDYCHRTKFTPRAMILMMIVNYTKVFSIKDIYLWGLYKADVKARWALKNLREEGYLERDKDGVKLIYYLSLKGQKVLADFYTFYDLRVKQQHKNNVNGNREITIVSKKSNKGNRKNHQPEGAEL